MSVLLVSVLEDITKHSNPKILSHMSNIRHSTAVMSLEEQKNGLFVIFMSNGFKWNQSEGRISGPLKIRWQFSWMENVPYIEDLQIGITKTHLKQGLRKYLPFAPPINTKS